MAAKDSSGGFTPRIGMTAGLEIQGLRVMSIPILYTLFKQRRCGTFVILKGAVARAPYKERE
jgi:hypothetical protein